MKTNVKHNLISFNFPYSKNLEVKNIKTLSKLKHYSGNGNFTKKCSSWLIKNLKCKEALLVNSCTAALEMCAILLNVKEKDEIIMPSFTFVSTANAFVLRGGTPVLVDIDPLTLNIDHTKIESCITKKTKAIVVVHYAGVSCEMDEIMKIAKKHKLYVIEDSAHAILSSYKNKPLGSIGDLATLSFHETKNIHCGEGGALLINNPKFIKRAKIIRDKGTNRDLFNKKIIKKYTWVDLGSSYVLSEINAAFLYAQFLKAKKITKYRKNLFSLYHKKLNQLELKGFIKRPKVPKYSVNNGHIYYIHIFKKKRAQLIEYLKKNLIYSVFHYIPIHSSPYGIKKCKNLNNMKYTNKYSKSILRLPIHYYLKSRNIDKIVLKISNFFHEKK
tara:strand:- start:71 stop:1228 length:1158 start_codon:yes stop_codon:yes gene_type:complete